jgi:lysine-specific demethylase/histidyl-hydroxylase NO66
MTLSRCVSLSPVEFLSGPYGTQHLHTPAARLPGYDDLLTPAVIDELLGGAGLRAASVRLVRDGREVPAPAIPERGDASTDPGYVDTDGIRDAINGGSTLILRSLHRYHPPLRRLAQSIARQLGAPVRVNAFITPPNAVGVDLHYDVQDVFVLQIAGTKMWHLRASPLALPLPSQAWFDRPAAWRAGNREASRHLGDVLLQPGDSLYLPRGTMHAPRSLEELSIHLTVAVSVPTRHDLLTRLLEAADEDEWFREHIALTAFEDNPALAADLLAEIAQRLRKVASGVDVASLLWKLRREAFRDLPAEPSSIFPSGNGAAPAGYRLRGGAQYAVTPSADGVTLHTPGKQVVLPAAAGPILEALRDFGQVSHAEISAACGEADAVRFATLLTDLGLVTADDSEPARS